MKYFKQKKYFIHTFHFPCKYTEINMNEISLYYDFSLECFLLLELSVIATVAHALWTLVEFIAFFCCPYLSYSLNKFHAVYFRLPSQLQ